MIALEISAELNLVFGLAFLEVCLVTLCLNICHFFHVLKQQNICQKQYPGNIVEENVGNYICLGF